MLVSQSLLIKGWCEKSSGSGLHRKIYLSLSKFKVNLAKLGCFKSREWIKNIYQIKF